MKNRNLDHKDDWATPPDVYAKLNEEFDFTFDPCPYQHDIEKWDGLEIEWGNKVLTNKKSKKMKKFLLYNNESDSEPWGVFDESMLNEEYGFTDQDVEDILKLEILETLVLDMNNVVLRFWDY